MFGFSHFPLASLLNSQWNEIQSWKSWSSIIFIQLKQATILNNKLNLTDIIKQQINNRSLLLWMVSPVWETEFQITTNCERVWRIFTSESELKSWKETLRFDLSVISILPHLEKMSAHGKIRFRNFSSRSNSVIEIKLKIIHLLAESVINRDCPLLKLPT